MSTVVPRSSQTSGNSLATLAILTALLYLPYTVILLGIIYSSIRSIVIGDIVIGGNEGLINRDIGKAFAGSEAFDFIEPASGYIDELDNRAITAVRATAAFIT